MKDLLNRARHEIIGLRRDNEILAAQVGVVNVFAVALGLNGAAAVVIAFAIVIGLAVAGAKK